jgi:hypothetical protein
MDVRELLTDGFERIDALYDDLADGLDERALNHRPGGTGNPIGWLLWHLARVQDDHVAGLTGEAQVWERWQERFGLDNGTDDIGFGHTSAQVDAVRIEDPALLVGYHRDVARATSQYLARVDEAELDRVGGATGQHPGRLPPAPRPGGVRQGPALTRPALSPQ